MSIMVVTPHADDETYGLGGFLLKNYKEKKEDVHIVLVVANDFKFYHSDRLVTAQERIQELNAVAQAVGATTSVIFNNRLFKYSDVDVWLNTVRTSPMTFDSNLSSVPQSRLVTEIEREIRERKPDKLFFNGPSFHADHTAVYRACVAATRPTFDYTPSFIALYENPTYSHSFDVTTDFYPNAYIDIADYVDEKVELLQLYKSQFRSGPNNLAFDKLKDWARYRGIESRLQYAEAIKIVRSIL